MTFVSQRLFVPADDLERISRGAMGSCRRRAGAGGNIPDGLVPRFVSEVPPLRAMTAAVATDQGDAEDEILAVRHRLPLLISARCSSTVTSVARRIHRAAFSPAAPLVMFPASELLEQRDQFAEQWTLLLEAGGCGSILITDIEEMAGATQALFTESLILLCAPRSTPAARLITGTSVSLLERVQAGRFSEELLYRLNVIHLQRRDGCDACPQCAART